MTGSSPYDVLIIGGGAAGMVAALEAARAGARVCLAERNDAPGRKIGITGKGRCNLTNACDREALMKHLIHNGRFLFSAIAALDNRNTMAYFEALGLPLKEERGRRVFPQSDKAGDVVFALRHAMEREGVELRTRARIQQLLLEDGRALGATLEGGQTMHAGAVIVATGGITYPATGSTGDGYALARAAGHTIVPPTPSLTPIDTQEAWCGALAGLALKNVRLTLMRGQKRIWRELGELLFTHTGIGGPLALTASAYLSGEELAQYTLYLDMKPGLSLEELEARVLRDLTKYANRSIGNSLFELLPRSFAPMALSGAGIDPATPCHAITKEQRRAFCAWLKAAPLTPAALRPPEEAVVTRGGVACREIQPGTMESKLARGLYFAGEVIDVDALTGGFNLQIAFSTGYVAGRHAARSATDRV